MDLLDAVRSLTSGITESLLNEYVGKNISEICTVGFTDPHSNHCAHFVGHVLRLNLGYCCGKLVPAAALRGFSVRVHEIFEASSEVGKFDANSPPARPCLIYVLSPKHVNVDTGTMDNVPKKHIGFYLNGTVWHYSNANHKVMTQSPADFIHHYAGQVNVLVYSNFPPGATFTLPPAAPVPVTVGN